VQDDGEKSMLDENKPNNNNNNNNNTHKQQYRERERAEWSFLEVVKMICPSIHKSMRRFTIISPFLSTGILELSLFRELAFYRNNSQKFTMPQASQKGSGREWRSFDGF
jgi:hypothetical protein